MGAQGGAFVTPMWLTDHWVTILEATPRPKRKPREKVIPPVGFVNVRENWDDEPHSWFETSEYADNHAALIPQELWDEYQAAQALVGDIEDRITAIVDPE